MSNKFNDIIVENLSDEIQEQGSSVEELALLRPEILKMSLADKLEAMADYVKWLKNRQDKYEPAEMDGTDYPGDTGDVDVPYDPDKAQEYEHWE